MATSDKELQKWLRQLVLQDEGRAAAKANPNSARILPSAGAVWWQFGKQSGGSNGDADPNGNNDGKDDNGKGKGKGEHDPTEMPEEGGDASGIGPLFECGKKDGKCINIRLNGVAEQPESFEAPCQPPLPKAEYDEQGYLKLYYVGHLVVRIFEKLRLYQGGAAYREEKKEISICKSFSEAYTQLAAFAASYPNVAMPSPRELWSRLQEIPGCYGSAVCSNESNADYDTPYFDPNRNDYFMFYKQGAVTYFSMRLSKHCCINPEHRPDLRYLEYKEGHLCLSKKGDDKDDTQNNNGTEWDKQACSEVIATANGFQAACPNLDDPNMPAIFKHHPTAFTLCDKEGNPVTIEQKGAGFAISTSTYTADVDSQLKFKNVKQKTPA